MSVYKYITPLNNWCKEGIVVYKSVTPLDTNTNSNAQPPPKMDVYKYRTPRNNWCKECTVVSSNVIPQQ